MSMANQISKKSTKAMTATQVTTTSTGVTVVTVNVPESNNFGVLIGNAAGQMAFVPRGSHQDFYVSNMNELYQQTYHADDVAIYTPYTS